MNGLILVSYEAKSLGDKNRLLSQDIESVRVSVDISVCGGGVWVAGRVTERKIETASQPGS